MTRIILIIATIVLTTLSMYGQEKEARKYTREGNKLYSSGDIKESEISYRKAIDARSDYYKARFNLGNVQYANENYEDAINLYKELTYVADDDIQKAELYYNIGNSYLKQKKYKEAYEVYKQSVMLNPADKDAKYNMLYARSKLQKSEENQNQEQQNQQQQQQQQEKEKQDNQDEQGDQEDKGDQEENKKQDDNNKDNQRDKGDEDQQEQQNKKDKNDKNKQKKESYEQQLERVAQNDKKSKEKADKKAAVLNSGKKKEKDW